MECSILSKTFNVISNLPLELVENWTLKDRIMDCKDAVAYTTAPQPNDDGTYPGAQYNVIQICPLLYVIRDSSYLPIFAKYRTA
jgi:hypothetical protein